MPNDSDALNDTDNDASDGTCNYNATAKNIRGEINHTPERSIILDTTLLVVYFEDSTSRNFIFANVGAYDCNLSNLRLGLYTSDYNGEISFADDFIQPHIFQPEEEVPEGMILYDDLEAPWITDDETPSYEFSHHRFSHHDRLEDVPSIQRILLDNKLLKAPVKINVPTIYDDALPN